jgi:hypothetical protein
VRQVYAAIYGLTVLTYVITKFDALTADESSVLGSEDVSLGEWFPTFRRNLVPSSATSKSQRNWKVERANDSVNIPAIWMNK